MHIVFFALVLLAFLIAGWRQLYWIPHEGDPTPMEALSTSMVQSATDSVELAIGLIGVMALFLGLMKVAEAGGLLKIVARLIRPLMVRLFPDSVDKELSRELTLTVAGKVAHSQFPKARSQSVTQTHTPGRPGNNR